MQTGQFETSHLNSLIIHESLKHVGMRPSMQVIYKSTLELEKM